jgi:ligand-binding SRPBCC domain-containing protein
MHTIISKQIINKPIKELWRFMQSPYNLEKITPPDMMFKVLTKLEDEIMYDGLVINYKVSPLLKIPMSWTSELKHINPPHFFVDSQLSGPYKVWHHQHILKEIDDQKTEMIDIINYELPFGILGRLLNKIIVKRKVAGIFEYRKKVLDKLFN